MYPSKVQFLPGCSWLGSWYLVAISYTFMGISQLPDVDFPVVTVTVTWAGASPDVMESAVADIVEDAVMSVDGIQLVQSTSQQGQAQIIIQFNLNQDINVALEQIQTQDFAGAKEFAPDDRSSGHH